MLKVSRKILITCCLIIVVSWVLQNVCEGFTQELEEQAKKKMSVTPEPTQNNITYEIGTVSTDFGDHVALVRKNILADALLDGGCKFKIKTYNVKDVLETVSGLRKDVSRLGNIMTSNFGDDPEKLKKLHAEFTSRKTEYLTKSNNELNSFNSRFSLDFSTSDAKNKYLMSHPSQICRDAGKEEAGYVHVLITNLDESELDHKGWVILDRPVTDISDKKPVHVTEEGLLYIEYNDYKYTLNVKTTRDERRTAIHDVDFERLLDTPGSGALQLWSNDPSLKDQILAEHEELEDIITDGLFKIEKRLAAVSGELIQKVDPIKSVLQSVTLPPINLNLNAREQFVRKINALTAGATTRAEAASAEYQELAKLALEGRNSVQVAINNMNSATQTLATKKMRLKEVVDFKAANSDELNTQETAVTLYREARDDLIDGEVFIITPDGKWEGTHLQIDKENQKRKFKALNIKDTNVEDKDALPSAESDADAFYTKIQNTYAEYARQNKSFKAAVTTRDELIRKGEKLENDIAAAKESVEAAKSALNSQTVNTQAAIRNVKIIEQRLPRAEKAEKIMYDRSKQVEAMGTQRIKEFDERAEQHRKEEERQMELKIAAERAAEARALAERKSHDAKVKAGGVGSLSNISAETRKLLLNTAKKFDEEREKKDKDFYLLEQQIDNLVSALKNSDEKILEKAKAIGTPRGDAAADDDDKEENFTQRATGRFSSRYGAGAVRQFAKYM